MEVFDSNKKLISKIVLSTIISSIILYGMYCCNNSGLWLGGTHLFTELQEFKHISDAEDREPLVFINVGYDKTMIDYYESGIYVGKTPVSDRDKLTRLLKQIKRSDYKYICLDIRFEEGLVSEYDSALFHEILSTERLVIPKVNNSGICDSSLLSKAFDCDYINTKWDDKINLFKYTWKSKDNKGRTESIPLKMYSYTKGNTISKKGPIFVSNGKLCQNSVFVTIPEEYINATTSIDDNGISRYLNMGEDILENPNSPISFDDAIVFIGDFTVDDQQPTYAGTVSGPLIVSLAYENLVTDKHIIHWWDVLLMLFILACMVLTLFSDKYWWDQIPGITNIKNGFFTFCLSFISYSVVLELLSVFMFLTDGPIWGTFVPSMLFSVMKNIKMHIN